MTLYIKKGDTRKPIAATLKSPKGVPIPLQGCAVRFKMATAPPNYKLSDENITSKLLINREALILDAVKGRVAFAFEPGETDQIGNMCGEFEVTYPDRSRETFPTSGYIEIIVLNTLD